jgi:hypothetical protein
MRFVLLLAVSIASARANSAYYQRVFFDNSVTADRYFYSGGRGSAPSQIELIDGKLPVETSSFQTAPNSLRVTWTSAPAGGWEAEINLYEWRNREINFQGDTLSFWCNSKEGARAADLPRLVLRDKNYGFTQPLDLTNLAQDLEPGKWAKIRIPMSRFATASIRRFQTNLTNTIMFVQGADDNSKHTLLVDEIEIEPAEAAAPAKLAIIQNVKAKGYEKHIDISWDEPAEEQPARYVVYRSTDGGAYQAVGIQVPGIHRFEDWLGKPGQTASYKVTVEDREYRESEPSQPASASTHAMTDDELLTMVQEACFRYYWEGAHPASGMIRENLPGDDDIVATGATGFGIMALVAGTDRGFITRQQGIDRLLKMTAFLERADRYHGVWPHFTNGATGKRMPVFGVYENGADLVETSFLMEGLLTARQYFKGESAPEKELYQRISGLWDSVEWDWFRRTVSGDALFWHWSPEYSWYINHRLTGWNEVMITYLLAIASPAHGVPASLYYTGWAGQSPAAVKYRQSWGRVTAGDHYVNNHVFEGIKLDVGVGSGGPLFFTQYSFMGFDPHARDPFTNYFLNNRNLARINYAYCQRNPGRYKGYGPNCWGITAVDGPNGYVPYEPNPKMDDGTIAPTGSIGSFPYTPAASTAALKHFYRDLGDRLWGEFGFRDAFNQREDWFSNIYMGLNQAPMVVMIENHRTGLIWKNFESNPEIQNMRKRIEFKVQ